MNAGTALVLRADAATLPLPDDSVDLIVTSPPYFALRSYRDGDEHYEGQIGDEPTPAEYLESLWRCTEEWTRVLKPTGSMFVNLGDKYAGSGGHNNGAYGVSGLHKDRASSSTRDAGRDHREQMRRRGPTAYNQSAEVAIGRRVDKNEQRYVKGEVPKKSLMGLPWRYANGCVDYLGLILRRDLVWSKPNGLPESVTDRCCSSHEYWFHLTKAGRYFSAVDEIREDLARVWDPTRPNGSHKLGVGGEGNILGRRTNPHGGISESRPNPFGRVPGSVWTIPNKPLIVPEWAREKYDIDEHFAAFPTEWPRRLILGWSPQGGTVLDPLGGTGTTAMVARALGRVGISVDLSMDYCRLARWRIFESGHGTKAESRTYLDRQGSLLDRDLDDERAVEDVRTGLL